MDPTSGLETIRQDLECCGTTFRSAYDCNQHYKTQHHDIPLSDPITWPFVHIRDPVKHTGLNLLLPYVPFPSAQPKTSTWTVRLGARAVTGDRAERERKRLQTKNLSYTIRSLKEQVAKLETTVTKLRQSRDQERTKHKDDENKEYKKRKEIQADKNYLQLQLDALRSAKHTELTTDAQEKKINNLCAENENLRLQLQAMQSDNERGLIQLLENEVERLGNENDELRARVKGMSTLTTPIM